MMIALAPFSTTISERMKAELGLSLPAANTRWIGRFSATPSAIRITAPSPINAVFSATATSSVAMVLPTWAATKASPFARASAIEPMLRPVSGERSESSGTKAPSTITSRRQSRPANICPADLACCLAAASGGGASGYDSRISARRSVYFQASTRRCGRPPASKRLNASSRSAATAPLLGNVPRAPANESASACSAGVLMARTSTFMASRRLAGIFGVALGFELKRQFLAAGLHHFAPGHHMHHVGHDVVEQPLIMRDHDHRALGRAQAVDAVGHDLERVDVEAG